MAKPSDLCKDKARLSQTGPLLPRREQSTSLSASSTVYKCELFVGNRKAVLPRHASMTATTGVIWLCACVLAIPLVRLLQCLNWYCSLLYLLLGYPVGCPRKLEMNRPFPSSPRPLFQNGGRCSTFDMEIIFHSDSNKTHFHEKGCAPSLILKVRVFGTRKWPIEPLRTILEL